MNDKKYACMYQITNWYFIGKFVNDGGVELICLNKNEYDLE